MLIKKHIFKNDEYRTKRVVLETLCACRFFNQIIRVWKIQLKYRFLPWESFGKIWSTDFITQDNTVKKLIAVLAPLTLALTACVSTGTTTGTTGATGTQSATQQLGMAAIKIAINAKCTTELNTIPAWQNATKLMTATQKQNIQTEICGCVSEKAPQNVTAVDLATAAIDPAARNTIVSNAVTKTINACVAEAMN